MQTIIYVLTNQAMPGLIKIGITDNLEKRIRDLSSSTSVPVPFQCYYARRVDNPKEIENALQYSLSDYRININREFFDIEPEKIKKLLETYSGENVSPTIKDNFTEEDKESLSNISKRKKFNFKMIGLEKGAIINFIEKPEITAEVYSETEILYNNEITTLSAAAQKIKNKSSLQGTIYWIYNGETLDTLRRKVEQGL